MKPLVDWLHSFLEALASSQWIFCAHPASGRELLHWANTGGPRSRVVSTPLVSRILSSGSETLGFRPLGHYQLPPPPTGNGFREFALWLLGETGFATPEQAWHALRAQLPNQALLSVDTPAVPDLAPKGIRPALIAALVLGKCCGSLFSPDRPIIWSERRLARSLRLVHCNSESFTRSDDE
jgi:hypothetical protein